MPYGSVVLRQFYRMFWIEYGQIIFYILRFFLYLLLKNSFELFVFYKMFYSFSLSYIDFVSCSIDF